MRIDMVFPRFKLLSGAERSILEIAAALARAGHRPRLLCHRFDDSCRGLLHDGVELVISGARLDFSRNRYVNAAFDYARVLGLRRLLDERADAVVLCGPALLLAAGHRLRRDRRPLVYYCFEPPRVLYQDRVEVLQRAGLARLLLGPALSLYRRIDRWLVARAGSITAVGPYPARRVQAVYGRPATALTLGFDRQLLDRAQPATPRSSLVTVNYLHPRKRVDLAIRALALLPAQLGGVPPTLEVVGEGPERGALQELAAALGVAGRVRFAGFVPEAQLGGHYRAADCYVHCTREESFGLSVIEAAYCGLPVVAVAEGGVVDNVLDGVSGRLVQATPAALAAGIVDVLADPARAGEMGRRGQAEIAGRYTWDRGAEDLLGAIEQARR